MGKRKNPEPDSPLDSLPDSLPDSPPNPPSDSPPDPTPDPTDHAESSSAPAKRPKTEPKKLKDIPTTKANWQTEATSLGVESTSINKMGALCSGSTVTADQFLAFRVIWPPTKKATELDIPNKERARQILGELEPYFDNYTRHIDTLRSSSPPIQLGPFQLVLSSQQMVENKVPAESTPPYGLRVRWNTKNMRHDTPLSHFSDITAAANSENPHKDFAPTKDEQIVNESLVMLLSALALNTPGIPCLWNSTRIGFRVDFETASMEARTDGYLGLRGGSNEEETFAILEAKSRVRTRKADEHSIYFQESAELVCWIKHDQKESRKYGLPALKTGYHSRLLIAQDRHEIYVVIATYDDTYIQYLNGEEVPSSCFMTMQEYGPFNTMFGNNMRRFAEFAIGFSLAIEADPLPQEPIRTSGRLESDHESE
ncbi:hypothetical protein P170DRAFT_472159 [Aspergillus steynii IBT 23096]|uniref:Uncharacterized protein n=1 Tax=Aspergillus steynii IBT 23096 TaxID=1392250 RepID=A0A2I2GH96_9EURO|nr:uncharacterized protein P170DRAFT_472159 [Aspergillus steynii IBT 23096]PLB52252.1 hypothetical protein P170DRAFT_472159 [Aspergillus steynii IBT 23096]